jgi:diaminopimelate decarboxylase
MIMKRKNNQPLSPRAWDLRISQTGELCVGNCRIVDLAKEYDTPLHVINEKRLHKTAQNFIRRFELSYPGKVSVHYAFKCNSLPFVVRQLRIAGLQAEVVTEFELDLALHLGYTGEQIVVNGPCKTSQFLRKCIDNRVRIMVVDSLDELVTLKTIISASKYTTDILLRINPDFIPKGMNKGSATASRQGCSFGLDLKGNEVSTALNILKKSPHIPFKGYHFHIGTGIRHPRDHAKALNRLSEIFTLTKKLGFAIEIMDVGGGFASATSRQMSTIEMLRYEGFNRLPKWIPTEHEPTFSDFAEEISRSMKQLFKEEKLPELIVEPGRCITSANQMLLLTVHYVKNRPGVGKWLITDGGLGTVSLPTYYEYHEIFLCNDVHRLPTERVTIIGPACFASDIVYRNKMMPEVSPGEIIAIMDSGAYFTALESSFGFPHPAVVSVNSDGHSLVRRREKFKDMINRDIIEKSHRLGQ